LIFTPCYIGIFVLQWVFRENGFQLKIGQYKVKPFVVGGEPFGFAQESLVELSNHDISPENNK